MIPLSGRNRSRERIAAADAIVAREEMRRVQLDAVARARASYFRLANVYAQIEINRKNLIALKQIAEISRAKYQVGEQSASSSSPRRPSDATLLESRRDLDQRLAAEESH